MVLVLNIAKGGVATAWMLHEMASRDRAPLALLLNFANPIMAQGAAHADFPLIDRFEVDITRAIRTGDQVTVDPAAGQVIVHAGGKPHGRPVDRKSVVLGKSVSARVDRGGRRTPKKKNTTNSLTPNITH